jgi:acetolactate synthase-1/2/3 large subunit
VKTILFNNQGDGMVRQWQKMFFAERFCGTEKFLHRKDFVNARERTVLSLPCG